MDLTLIGLHGFTLNGAAMHSMLGPLVDRLPNSVTVECPDGPRLCNESSVERMKQLFGGVLTPPPHRCWYDSSDDGRVYHGLDQAREELAQLVEHNGPRVGLLGFSQGATTVAALAALSAHRQFPELAFVVLIAGRVPRADDIAPLLTTPLTIPSLHVWGDRDLIAAPYAEALVEQFDPETRRVVMWPGPHRVPTRGEAADAIVDFISEYAE